MDAPQHFRTALNGFRREDVVRYLEYLNAKHTTEINRYIAEADSLHKEIEALKNGKPAEAAPAQKDQELEELHSRLDAAEAEKKSLEEKLLDLETAPKAEPAEDILKALQEEKDKLLERCQKAEERSAALETQLEALRQEKEEHPENLADKELEAYRRAERAERVATEKADLIYHRTNAVLDEAAGKIDGASAELTELAEKISAQLQQMQYSINTGKQALKGALDTMQTLRENNR